MKTSGRPGHHARATALRQRVLEAPAKTDPALRQAVAASAGGGKAAPQPFEAIARQIGDAACQVTDVDVTSIVRAAGSERGAFEIIYAAAVGAGLLRWDRAVQVVKEAGNAPA